MTRSGWCNQDIPLNHVSHRSCTFDDCPCECATHATIGPVTDEPATEPLIPGSPAWTRLMTASKVAAVLGLSPWQSPYSLWMEMAGRVHRPATNEAQARGIYLEAGILAWWRDQHPEIDDWRDQPEYRRGGWAAATPDRVAWTDCEHDNRADCLSRCEVLVEAKTAAYDSDWGEPGTDEIPAYYYAQVVWQMHVSGVHACYVPVLTSRLNLVEYVVTYNPDDGAAMERICREFYDSLAADVPPDLDDHVATFDVVRRLHPQIDRGSEVEVSREDAERLVVEQDIYKTTEPRLRGAKARVIDAMGRAQYATHQGVRIARRQPRGDDVTFVVVAKPADLTDQTAGDAA